MKTPMQEISYNALVRESGFNARGFQEYLENEFVFNSFSREMIEKIIEFGLRNYNYCKGQFVYFLQNLLPDEVLLCEILQFANDDILTNALIEEKAEWNKTPTINIEE